MASFPLSLLHPQFYVSHFGPVFFLILLLRPSLTVAVNVTALLAAHPDLSEFNRLLTSTEVAGDLPGRSSLTLLAVPNPFLLRSSLAAGSADLADVLRYHVLLEYLSLPDLLRIPAGAGKLVATLYQTTGRAAGDLGDLNLTRLPSGAVAARSPAPFSSASNATILTQLAAFPYNVSVLTVDSLLIPSGFDLAASESRPPAGVNVTRVLVDGKDFNVAASMLEASGVAEEFEADEGGAGITVFAPSDEAFAELPATERLQSLPADQKAAVLRFHVLHSYYPLGSLESIVNPVQPTLATEGTGAGHFTLNISRVNGSVAIDTGLVQASITRTVFDQNPVAVFAVSRVLLPKEIFGKAEAERAAEEAPPPAAGVVGIPPEGADSPPARLSSPPGFKGEVRSEAGRRWIFPLVAAGDGIAGIAPFCMAAMYLLLV